MFNLRVDGGGCWQTNGLLEMVGGNPVWCSRWGLVNRNVVKGGEALILEWRGWRGRDDQAGRNRDGVCILFWYFKIDRSSSGAQNWKLRIQLTSRFVLLISQSGGNCFCN